ncbi:hypothetical protein [Gluconobacter sp. NFX36]|uniref:hypothetical protein n=1 Tax=Gluconobacter sp. NFX36 TaxID=2819535 RepID=UPI003CF984CB
MSSELASYDSIIVAVSGGKDGTACLLALLEAGAPEERIELWHHEVDGAGRSFMDWPSTGPYVATLARDFSLPLYRSLREGGFEREILRDAAPTAPVVFETPDGVIKAGGQGPEGTRLRFPRSLPACPCAGARRASGLMWPIAPCADRTGSSTAVP